MMKAQMDANTARTKRGSNRVEVSRDVASCEMESLTATGTKWKNCKKQLEIRAACAAKSIVKNSRWRVHACTPLHTKLFSFVSFWNSGSRLLVNRFPRIGPFFKKNKARGRSRKTSYRESHELMRQQHNLDDELIDVQEGSSGSSSSKDGL